MNIDSLRYPIGKFQNPGVYNAKNFLSFVDDIERFPARLVQEVGPLTPEQVNWIYRPEGWTIRQVVHHCADSHMNAFSRIKLALTEDRPTIKPYLEAEWAKHTDYDLPVVHSIKLLEGLHMRWSALLKGLGEEQLMRSFLHPENGREWSLYFTTALYAWHCNHHLGHVKQAKAYRGEFLIEK